MATFYDRITEDQTRFIQRRHIFFTATAPPEGRLNLSPKGMDSFRVIDPHTVAYLDLTGSGNETAAHLQHDGRITFMFCSFDQKPNILRLYGTGRAIRPGDPEFDDLMPRFNPIVGQRQIIHATITSTQDSCGYAVPRMDFREERHTLVKWAETQGPDGLTNYRAKKNTASIDGLAID